MPAEQQPVTKRQATMQLKGYMGGVDPKKSKDDSSVAGSPQDKFFVVPSPSNRRTTTMGFNAQPNLKKKMSMVATRPQPLLNISKSMTETEKPKLNEKEQKQKERLIRRRKKFLDIALLNL